MAATANRAVSLRARLLPVFLSSFLVVSAASRAGATDVTTYHYDNLRTGWNSSETMLTPERLLNGVGGKTFKLMASVPLDEQVDAQPLVVANQTIKGKGSHEVVYVATENNTLYALDANTGEVLRQRNFGPPVPLSALAPGGCHNNSAVVGIGSTPVIDRASGRLYLIAYTYFGGRQQYAVHAVSLETLADAVPPVRVTASGRLSDGSTYSFNAAVSRQRAALLLANGNVYAGFASFCDQSAHLSRGWLLGWSKRTLAPLRSNRLTNRRKTSPNSFFLTSIWMSGYGPAASAAGDIYFVTGNSDYSGNTINSVLNVAESAVQVSPNLAVIKSVFTPDDAANLDVIDSDFGSGGLMLLPQQQGASSNLAVAAGKDGNMYLLNADNLNNNTTGPDRILGTYQIGGCWCGQSYFTAPDGSGRVVTSGGDSVSFWKVVPGQHSTLHLLRSTASIGGDQDPGFFTVVSSNGLKMPIVWAVSRPDASASHDISLFAFHGATAATLMSAKAGTWPNVDGNANIVPVVANGKVYVASYKTLSIFGLSAAPAALAYVPPAPALIRVELPPGMHEVFGTVRAVSGTRFTLVKRDGTAIEVDAAVAAREHRLAEPAVGRGTRVRGAFNEAGTFEAWSVLHAKPKPAMWPADR